MTWFEMPDSAGPVERQVEAVYFSASRDGSASFSRPVRINPVSDHAMAFAVSPDHVVMRRHLRSGGVAYVVPWRGSGGTGHMGLTADADGGFRVIWADRRTGIRRLWTTRVTVLGPIMSKVLKVSDKIGGLP